MRIPSLFAAIFLILPASASTLDAATGQGAIKALSEREIADLEAGRGMGLAKAAELNGVPGPMHVLEHAEALALTPDQRTRTEALFARMRADAQVLGARMLDAERGLDALFASGGADAAGVDARLAHIGQLQAALRGVHLSAHLEQTALLTPTQRARYAVLRGHADASSTRADHPHQH